MSDDVIPPWLAIARGELGVKEMPGAESNPRVIEYIRTVHGREDDTEYAWCSAFVNWCMTQAGMVGTGKGAARSWARWGDEIKAPRIGCIAVLWRETPRSAKGHVGFYSGEDERGRLLLTGGNQLNAVVTRPYPRERLLSYRWPSEAMLAAARPAC